MSILMLEPPPKKANVLSESKINAHGKRTKTYYSIRKRGY